MVVLATSHGTDTLAGLLLADAWSEQDGNSHAIPEALSASAELLLFAMLGAAFAPLVGSSEILQGIALTIATVLLLRPMVASLCLVSSGLERGERVLVSWGGLKGAVPLLLAAYPGLEDFGDWETVAGVVLVATAVSLIVQGTALPFIANRTSAPPRSFG